MPNLIGTGNNQVPTNGMLGGLAYQSPDSVVINNLELTNLSGHSSVIPSTAVDVFVYDTRKDSDGGAWRKRTQHTSWYNETLNTPTRGSRREFPAVAVIVASTSPNRVTVYDGDDPDMPMWMVFTSNVNQYGAIFNNRSVVSVVAVNGSIIWADSLDSVVDVSFIKDTITSTAVSGSWNSMRNVLNRNPTDTNNLWTNYNSSRALISYPLYDVATTVLPNAPIDPSTGLPVPTVAVATQGGVTMIKDDGTVENTDNAAILKLGFVKGDRLAYGHRAGYEYAGRAINVSPFRNSFSYGFYVNSTTPSFGYQEGSAGKILGVGDGYVYGYDYAGIRRILEDETNKANGMANYIGTTYNTGWMHGDIKGAWLSDTSTASVTGTELVTNGTFDSNTTGWTTFNSTNTWSSGAMQITRSGGSGAVTYQAFTTVAGQRYVATATVNSSGSRGDMYIMNGTGWAGTQLAGITGTTGQTRQLTAYFTAASTTTTLGFAIDANGTSIIVDNVSVRREELDRSVNNQGLAVYGTLTKTSVATNADLVAYSGFSTTNYLSQPYNSSLNFNTGSFSLLAWIYPTGTSVGAIIGRGGNGVYGPYALNYYNNKITFVCSSDWNESTDLGSWGTLLAEVGNVPLNTWSFISVTFSGTTARVFVNGSVVATQTNAVNPKAPTSNFIPTMVGVERVPLSGSIGRPFPGSLALVRASASAPSPEQILKIYNDEKALFQENSKATLYGSSDTVTAIAYDDTTRLLHVGTPSGRSDFQGLERVANTTTAVSTAISASNGLVAEQ
jgi:hypothetical protein